jgi:hypothetical protein
LNIHGTTISGSSSAWTVGLTDGFGKDIYRDTAGLVTVYSTCPTGFYPATATVGSALFTNGYVDGSLYSCSGCTRTSTCTAGSYASNNSQGTCAVCPAGKYTELTGAVACVSCVAGKYLVDTATVAALHDSASDCQICLSGKYASSSGSSSCTSCPIGRYLSDSGTAVSLHDSLDDCTVCLPLTTSVRPRSFSFCIAVTRRNMLRVSHLSVLT